MTYVCVILPKLRNMYAKTDQFDEEKQSLAQDAKVFSHPARLAIIALLAERKECIVGDIAQEFPFLSRTTVSQHLQELKNAGIIQGEVEGVKVCYCLDFKALDAVQARLKKFFGAVEKLRGGCC